MQPPQQPMGAQQPYYGYQQPATAMPLISKKMIFLIVAAGALLLWIAQLMFAFRVNPGDQGTQNALRALYYTGAAIGLGGSLLGSLGSPRTSDWQNVGLLILAGFFLLALA